MDVGLKRDSKASQKSDPWLLLFVGARITLAQKTDLKDHPVNSFCRILVSIIGYVCIRILIVDSKTRPGYAQEA